jgi:creatinine amidohydrolase
MRRLQDIEVERRPLVKLLLEEMTRDEAREAFDQGALVVLPTGSVEQHGPHLPLVVDTCIVTHLARAAAERARATVPLIVAPTMHYGVSHHHLDFAGTLSLPGHLYEAVLEELLRCLHHHGARRVVLVNGHGGNTSANTSAADALVYEDRLEMVIGNVSYWSLPIYATNAAGQRERITITPGHANRRETSLMLALRPDLVHLDRRMAPLAPLFSIEQASEFGAFQRAGGITDDSAGANAEEGRLLFDAAADAVADYLVRFYEQTGPGVVGR